ncbi:MAG TPA: hypothetical protein VG125_21490 [Pirellulales bacterium]|jgi:hypothetical protein|nr:hypothetical protein [Pirellulales bacterium]
MVDSSIGDAGEGLPERGAVSLSAARRRKGLLPYSGAGGWQTAVLLGLLVLVQFCGLMLIPLSVTESVDFDFWESFLKVAKGLSLAPPTLLAFWAVFGPERTVVRLPLTLWLAAVMYLAKFYGESRGWGLADAAGMYLLSDADWLLAFALVQVPLWFLRIARNWRLEWSGVPTTQTTVAQFTVFGMFGWTFAAASLFAAMRWLVPGIGFQLDEETAALEDIGSDSVSITLAGLPVLALTWITLASGRRPVLRWSLAAIILLGLPAGSGLLAYLDWTGLGMDTLACMSAGALLDGLISLGVIWGCGFRLNRCSEASIDAPIPAEASARAEPPQKHFALAVALLAVCAAAIACAVPDRREVWRQGDVTAEWKRGGMSATFDEDGRLTHLIASGSAPISDDTLRRIARLDDLKGLALTGLELDDRRLSLLADLSGLRHLVIDDADVTDAGLSALVHFRQLESLELTNTRVTDEGLAALPALPKLAHLDVSFTAVTEAGTARFRHTSPQVAIEFGASDDRLSRKLTRPRCVSVEGYFFVFGRGPHPLKRLCARGKEVTDSALAPLADHTELEELDLRETAITDLGMTSLASLAGLKQLDLRDTVVTNAGLVPLARLARLRRVDLRGTRVTLDGCQRLIESLPNCEVLH